MKLIQLTVAVLAILTANIALASVPLQIVPVPVEDGGLLAVAAVCLAVGIRIARRKHNR